MIAFIVVICWYTSSVNGLKIKSIKTREYSNMILYNNKYSAHSGVRRIRLLSGRDERLRTFGVEQNH